MTASLNPTTAKLLDLYIEKQSQHKKDGIFIDELRKQIQDAINLGELDELIDKERYVYNGLSISVYERKSWKYSAAVDALREQEQFNGTATQTTATSYRFTVKTDDES
jgi:hypothetical protein